MKRILAALAIAALPLAAYAQSFTPAQKSEMNQIIYDFLLKCNVATGCPVPTPPAPLPMVAFSANPTSVTSGNASTLMWSSINATSCVASGGWTGTKAANGTQSVSPTSTATYGLSCTGPGGASPITSATVTVTPVIPPVTGNCGMQLGGTAIFCDRFDVAKNPAIQSRTGSLDPNVWGVSRISQQNNLGQGMFNQWTPPQVQTCSGTTTIMQPNEVVICNGQLREANNDAGVVTALAMYPKQPFDFAGRTGTVSFDVSNDSHGNHAAWPEFWLSDLPIPAPFFHSAGALKTLPQHGFGIRFDGAAGPGQQGLCQNGNNLDKRRWTIESAIVVRNYVIDDNFNPQSGPRTNMTVQQFDCVIAPPDNSGIMNHVELRISQNQIEVWATDAGVAPSPTTLKKVAAVNNANLSLTRGLIWIEDVHYNADKGDVPSQRNHTFVWDNVAFDGPFVYRDFSYDSLDANEFYPSNNTWNLGKRSFPGQTASWNVLGVPANPQAAVVRVLFNFYQQNSITGLNVIVNGHAHTAPWPYPDVEGNVVRTFAVTIPITDLVPGTNVVQLGSSQEMVTSNVNIVLVNVPGGVPVLPGSNNAYPN